jgi:VanZ family protein
MINKKIILTILTVVWMLVIFLFSNQKASNSTQISNSFIDNTVIKIYRIFDSDASLEDIKLIREYFFLPVRKLAHFAVYCILGILMIFTLKEYGIRNDLIYYSILICFLYAVSDEVHQLFVVGRSGEIKDVILDTLGSILGILCFKKRL